MKILTVFSLEYHFGDTNFLKIRQNPPLRHSKHFLSFSTNENFPLSRCYKIQLLFNIFFSIVTLYFHLFIHILVLHEILKYSICRNSFQLRAAVCSFYFNIQNLHFLLLRLVQTLLSRIQSY